MGRGRGLCIRICQELEVASCGDSPQEALDNIREVIELYISDYDELAPMEFIGLQQIEVTV